MNPHFFLQQTRCKTDRQYNYYIQIKSVCTAYSLGWLKYDNYEDVTWIRSDESTQHKPNCYNILLSKQWKSQNSTRREILLLIWASSDIYTCPESKLCFIRYQNMYRGEGIHKKQSFWMYYFQYLYPCSLYWIYLYCLYAHLLPHNSDMRLVHLERLLNIISKFSIVNTV